MKYIRVLPQQYIKENDKTVKMECKEETKLSVQCQHFDNQTCLCYCCTECSAIVGNNGKWSAVAVLRALQGGDLTET